MEMSNVWPTILAALPSVVVSIVGILFGVIQWINEKRRARNAKTTESLKEKLRCFYYPYLLLENENTEFYHLFIKDKEDDEVPFRTLTFLVNGRIDELSDNDKTILNTIVHNDIELYRLINQSGQHVDSNELRNDLSKIAVHYKLMELAYSGKIQEQANSTIYSSYVYPRGIKKKIQDEAARIEGEIKKLRS